MNNSAQWFYTLIFLAVIGCNNDEGSVTPPTVVIEPTLQSIQSVVFNNCSTLSCHGTGKGGLTLVNGKSYEQLVNQLSIGDGEHSPKFFRVKPFSPDSSFLYIKITNPHSVTQGDRMPQAGSPLSQNVIDVIKLWIAQGAKNN
ncbi:MAG: hypothetical protein Q8L88_14240 [Bacteroidota bacterium]|nr:hypothetical protein [Bacteroidota bacterium]